MGSCIKRDPRRQHRHTEVIRAISSDNSLSCTWRSTTAIDHHVFISTICFKEADPCLQKAWHCKAN